MHTTLSQLKGWSACTDGYRDVVKGVGLDYDQDKPILLSAILESNNRNDVFWLLRRMDLTDEQIADLRLLAVSLAETVLPIFEKKYPNDTRPRYAIEGARAYITGDITKEKLIDLRRSAYADYAAYAAYAAAAAYAVASAAAAASAAVAAAAAAASAVHVAAAAVHLAADAVHLAADAAELKEVQHNLLKSFLLKHE